MKNEFYEFEIHENAQDGKFSSRKAAMQKKSGQMQSRSGNNG